MGSGLNSAINLAVCDDGSNVLLITEQQCKQLGISILTTDNPQLKAIDGELRQYVIGRTPAAKLTIGRGTPYPLTAEVQCLYVIAGDAGGMYDVLIDKETFKAYFAHANPVYQHFIWYPLAPQNDFSVIAGVPIRGSVSHRVMLAALQHGIPLSALVHKTVAVGQSQPGTS